jgi:hypothetical protein
LSGFLPDRPDQSQFTIDGSSRGTELGTDFVTRLAFEPPQRDPTKMAWSSLLKR